MKIYIAGKITGFDGYKERFSAKEKELKSYGYTVLNPAILPHGLKQEEYMHICYSMIDVCDAVYFLDNFMDSEGARLEYMYAKEAGKKIYIQNIKEIKKETNNTQMLITLLFL